MAELGQTTDPTELVPGQPGAIDRNVLAIRGRGETMGRAGDSLTRIDTGAWIGEAGDAFRDKFDVIGFVGDVGVGLWDGASGLGEFLWDISPHHLITDPESYGETMSTYAAGKLAKLRKVSKLVPDVKPKLGDYFTGGGAPKASDLHKYAEAQGWAKTQTPNGPPKYVDENGERGPHVEIRDEHGQRTDPDGNPARRKSPDNHTPIEWDF